MIDTLDSQMKKTIESLNKNFNAIRTSRANPEMLSFIKVSYYGAQVPLLQLATITVPESRVFQLQCFDAAAIPDIERAILKSNLNLNPQVDGTSIRIVLPDLTEERRRELVKLIYKQGEDSKISIRNIRRDFIDQIKKQEKDKMISEDTSKHNQVTIQNSTNDHIKTIDDKVKLKEIEILKV